MSREFKTIFFYRADDDLLLTFVASRSDGRGSFCFFLGLIMVHSKSGAHRARCRLMARSDISRRRSNSVAFGAKRTLSGFRCAPIL